MADRRWPESKVTAIDVSETSIRSAEELKRKHRLDNLDVRLLPVFDASA
jgi:trans-aconitate methyltransferase